MLLDIFSTFFFTSSTFSFVHITNNSCAVAHLLIIHLKPLSVGIVILNLMVLLHFCCLEILPGIILLISGFFSISNKSFANSGMI